MMKVGILTSSRSDYGIYFPLLKKLFVDNFFQPEIIAFGAHLSEKFGETIKEIENDGFIVKHQIQTVQEDDSPKAIALSISRTVSEFSDFWNKNKFDLVFALGDRYEMLGAVLSGSPFNVPFAHIHAGETTLGAIDNAYRHSISLMSRFLFVSTEQYKKRAIELAHNQLAVFNVGALSIDNLKREKLYTKKEFYERFKIDINIPTILTTFHPETVRFEKNRIYIEELVSALNDLTDRYQIVVTMPNADTEGLMIRNYFKLLSSRNEKVILVESFGRKGYLSCMKYCRMLLGNTSSAFVEASFFPKWVINLGNRQKGRILTPNLLTIPVQSEKILETVYKIENTSELPEGCNLYGNGDASERICSIIKNMSL